MNFALVFSDMTYDLKNSRNDLLDLLIQKYSANCAIPRITSMEIFVF